MNGEFSCTVDTRVHTCISWKLKAHNKTHDEKHIDDDDREKLKARVSKILKLRMKLLRIVRSR